MRAVARPVPISRETRGRKRNEDDEKESFLALDDDPFNSADNLVGDDSREDRFWDVSQLILSDIPVADSLLRAGQTNGGTRRSSRRNCSSKRSVGRLTLVYACNKASLERALREREAPETGY